MMPHDPHTPPERLLARYRELAPSEHVARYWAMIEWFDETVGQLLDHLDTQGLAKNTVVVYLADNGWIQNVDAPRYAPKSKQSPYDGGVRTPILLRWPEDDALEGRHAGQLDRHRAHDPAHCRPEAHAANAGNKPVEGRGGRSGARW